MKLLLLVALLGVAYVAAECPEACNGHGFCGEYDKCSCYRNWQGNSCADRTCPFDLAFVDIPHGDLNMNGKLDDEITTYGAQINDVYAFEVYPTDGYQIERHAGTCTNGGSCFSNADCPASESCTDTTASSTNTDASADDKMYETLTANEKAASFYDMAEDGHFYAECSNKGMCDRKSGQCDCFDGYSGTACRRVACPNDCSGHGTCETLAEFGFAYDLWDRYKTQVCTCDPGYFGIDCAQRHCPYGDDPLSADEHNEIQWLTLKSVGDGTSGSMDSLTAHICADDGETPCNVDGDCDDSTAGTCSLTTYTEGDLDLEGTFRLAYKDEYGETWNTSPIKAHSYDIATPGTNTATAAAIKAALEGIPNSVFEEVDVELWPIQTPIPGTYTLAVANTATLNAQTNQLVVNADTTTLVPSSQKYKWGLSNCQNGSGGKFQEAVDSESGKFKWTSGSGLGSDAAATLCRYQMNGFRAKITFKKNPGDINELTCDADKVTTGEHKDSSDPATDIECTALDYNEFELGAIGTMAGSVIGGGNGGRITTNMPLSSMITDGDRIRVAGKCADFSTNSEWCYTDDDCVLGPSVCDDTVLAPQTYTIAGPVNEPANADALANIIVEEETPAAIAITDFHAPAAVWWGKGTTENVECSHRGLCNHDEGLCECFTGYTHDDCSMQDALNA